MATKKMSAAQFTKELKAALERKDGYIMGAYGQNPRTGKLDLNDTNVGANWKENGYYYRQYSGSQRTQALKWRKDSVRVWDCNGLAEGIYQLFSGVSINTQARYNYKNWCDPRGSGMIPKAYRVPGAAVFKESSYIHHVGFLYEPVDKANPQGDWYVIEAKGVMYGVIKSKLLSGGWNKWGLMTKYFDYETTSVVDAQEYVLGGRLLKNGVEGDDVMQLQQILLQLGYELPKYGADGEYGGETAAAVKKLQKLLKVQADGEYGEETHAALMAHIEQNADDGDPEELPAKIKIRITAAVSAYVRTGPGTTYGIITVVKRGMEYDSMAVAENGWHCITVNGKIGWVSGKMCEEI